ncbi:MAG: aminotransferase class I/II-fold pyridoxal phosphate-dependent enzyme [Syntrophomonadaceae bacterium]|nr:aminotransferase class I/II-fold pyridoxal phosphate-dependent enzyme [Syntrophomonadaceae bacterium]
METPLYDSLIEYILEDNLRLHMPGHIGKLTSLAEELQMVAKIDLTEVPSMDDLHLPVGAIKEALHLFAKAYNAKESIFLVNGATSGINALFLALASDKGKILIPRSAHRSFYTGLVLSGLWPVYLEDEFMEGLDIPIGAMPNEIAEKLKSSPNISGAFLTSPNYYGITTDVKQMSELCQAYCLPLLIDEAHGSHFPFHPLYPTPALSAGADAVVNGLHKTLPVLNQGAVLNIGFNCTFTQKLRTAASLITTTSPSFPILASIDLARALMESEGEGLLEEARILSAEYNQKINSIKGLRTLSAEFINRSDFSELDPLKLVVIVDKLSIDGYQVADILLDDYKIQVEWANTVMVLGMFSILHTRDDWERFYYALEEIAVKYMTDKLKPKSPFIKALPKVLISPRQAFFSPKKTLRLKDSVGLIAGEMVTVYPPGIPVLLPGELITADILDYLLFIKANNWRIQGLADEGLNYIDVIEYA